MTTIVYRDGILAADSRAYSGAQTPIGTKHKIGALSDGTLVAISTTMPGLSERVMQFLEAGLAGGYEDNAGPEPDVLRDNFTMLLVDPEGQVFYASNSMMLSGPLEAECFAIGSGCEYALGAMYAGADAVSAVQAAIKGDPYTGYPVISINQVTKEVSKLG